MTDTQDTQQQSINDHFKAQRCSDGLIRKPHPRQRQTHKLSNISTIAFLSYMKYAGIAQAHQLKVCLPLEIQLLKDDSPINLCFAKLVKLDSLGLVEWVTSNGFTITGEGLRVLNERRIVTAVIENDDSEDYNMRKFFQLQLEKYLPTLQREVIVPWNEDFHKPKDAGKLTTGEKAEYVYGEVLDTLNNIEQYPVDVIFATILEVEKLFNARGYKI